MLTHRMCAFSPEIGPASVMVGNLVSGKRIAQASGRDLGQIEDNDQARKVSNPQRAGPPQQLEYWPRVLASEQPCFWGQWVVHWGHLLHTAPGGSQPGSRLCPPTYPQLVAGLWSIASGGQVALA